jgi:hypothetical protein
MKKILSVLALTFCLSITSYAQVAIGTNTPSPSAQFEVFSTERGFLPPRMTSAQRDSIATPATGLLIFQTNNTAGYYYYNGTAWVNLGAMGAAGTNGTNGLNALIKTTTEVAGANCANGGTKIETGLDVNGNGVLEAGEVNILQTTFICNVAGTVGGSVQFSNIQKYSTPGTYSWTCPVGVTKVMVELWGGGGGGGSTSGGQGGGYGKQIVSVTSGTSYSIIIGAGGGPSVPGGNTSCFGILSYGGNDGSLSGASNIGTSNAIISITGQGGGGNPCSNQNNHGEGGGSGGGYNVGTCGNGNFPGGGGGAPCSCTNSPNSSGANGCVVIYF